MTASDPGLELPEEEYICTKYKQKVVDPEH